ncbi:hypothetical protein OCK74_22960 [Chitinophagaceae bacterium LB-8]|uniref:Uncharacterized protein n=1 Tax=Paraflavisolibacter caeni TaxID=2982496 RepID=A0A9X2XPW6_9BACT|nr:hypothetical protein [Paraflavisolibacter caeni]MCU7551999.1 hypothetical protein [Paraflavisolibacter caeni]
MRRRHELKKKSGAAGRVERGKEDRTLGNDYWDRVADDVAAGYKSKKDDDNILNIDQEPGDHESGDMDHTS